MKDLIIFSGEFSGGSPLPFASGGVKAGFPSPAQDYMAESLDFDKDLIEHPAATFYARVVGDSMIDAGINEGDIVVIDKALEPEHGDIVVAFIDGEFTLKFIDLSHKDEGYIELRPANKKYSPIRVYSTDNFKVWGVLAWSIKPRRASLMNRFAK